MIRRYNQAQIFKAVALVFGGSFFCCLAYLFFRYLSALMAAQFHFMLSTSVFVGIGLFGVAVAWFSGYRTWKARGGLFSYHESGLYHDLGDTTAGAFIIDGYAHRVTGLAYILGQIFMAGPQCILRAWTLFMSRIPQSADLERRLESTLAVLRNANKWQGLADYPYSRTEILYLAQIGLIDFSAHKGTPRFKAS